MTYLRIPNFFQKCDVPAWEVPRVGRGHRVTRPSFLKHQPRPVLHFLFSSLFGRPLHDEEKYKEEEKNDTKAALYETMAGVFAIECFLTVKILFEAGQKARRPHSRESPHTPVLLSSHSAAGLFFLKSGPSWPHTLLCTHTCRPPSPLGSIQPRHFDAE